MDDWGLEWKIKPTVIHWLVRDWFRCCWYDRDWLIDGWLLETKMNLYWALYGKLDPNSHVPYKLTSIEKSLIYLLVLSTHYSQEPDSFHPVYEE